MQGEDGGFDDAHVFRSLLGTGEAEALDEASSDVFADRRGMDAEEGSGFLLADNLQHHDATLRSTRKAQRSSPKCCGMPFGPVIVLCSSICTLRRR